MNGMGRAIMADVKKKFDSFGVSIDDFGAVGDGTTDDYAAFNLFRAYVAAVQAASSTAWVTLNLTPGKTYASRDNGWLLGLTQVIVNGNGAHFKNICTAGQSAFDFDHFPIVIGGLGYVDNVTTMMSGKGHALNYTGHYRINTGTQGAASVTTTTAADAGNFAVGDPVLICSNIAFVGGSPPSMHFFEYGKVLTAVAGTGVITLDGTLLRNSYSASLDNTLKSGDFGSAARIFKLNALWDCDLVINDLVVDPAANFPGFAAYVFGRNITTRHCRFPGITVTLCDSYHSDNDRFENTTGYEPVDKLVRLAVFNNPRFISGSIGGDGSGGQVVIRGGSIDGQLRAWKNTHLDQVFLGGSAASGAGLKLGNAQRFSARGCTGPALLVSPVEAITLTMDGATITSTATTIVVPRSSITQGSTLGQFYGALTVGCRIDEVSDTSSTAYTNGKFAIVTSITDSGANLVIGVNYSGGTSIANGTVFRAPGLIAYQAEGNMGTGGLISNANPQSTYGIPNGGLDAIRGNYYRMLIAPETGGSYGNAAMPVNGIPKRIWARVNRIYTGGVHATLGLEILGVQPTAAQYARIDLKTLGVREATRSAATAALGADTWAVLPATYTGRLNMVINVTAGGAAAALGTGTETLPMVEIIVEFEDVAHSVAVAA